MKNKKKPQSLYKPFLHIVLVVFLLASCREEEILPVEEVTEEVPTVATNAVNSYVNSWILDNMEYWYLWNDELPSKTDKNLDPESYF